MFFFRDNYKRRSLQFMQCVNLSDRNVIVRHHNNGKNSVYSGKLLPARLPAFFYCCKETKINHQADQKQNTRTANSVTGPVSTSVGIGESLTGCGLTVVCLGKRAGAEERDFPSFSRRCYSDMDIPIPKTLAI